MPKSRRRKPRIHLLPVGVAPLRFIEIVCNHVPALAPDAVRWILDRQPPEATCCACGKSGFVLGALEDPELIVCADEHINHFKIFCPRCAPAGELRAHLWDV